MFSLTRSTALERSVLSSDTLVPYLVVTLTLGCYVASILLEVQFLFFNLCLGLIVFALAVVRTDLALMFVPLALANPYGLKESGTNLIISEFILLTVFVGWLIRQLADHEQYHFPRFLLYASLAMIGTALTSLVSARYFFPGFLQVVRYLEVLIFLPLVILSSCRSEASIKRIGYSFLVAGLFASVMGVAQFLQESAAAGASRRVSGMLGGGYGAVIASTFLMGISLLFHGKERIWKALALITIPVAGLALLVSQTRAWIRGVGNRAAGDACENATKDCHGLRGSWCRYHDRVGSLHWRFWLGSRNIS